MTIISIWCYDSQAIEQTFYFIPRLSPFGDAGTPPLRGTDEKNAPPETPITNQRSACDWERRSKKAGGWPFAKQKAEAKQTLLRRGGGWIRFSAEKPRRLKRATGAFPRAAFRIHNKKRPTCWRDVCWWRRVDSNHRSESQQIYSLPPLATRELLHMDFSLPAPNPVGDRRGYRAGGAYLGGTGSPWRALSPRSGRFPAGNRSALELVDGLEPPTC